MPKKFTTENTKAVAARERKKAAQDETQKEEKELEDAKWKDCDKQALKKQQRKEADDRKRCEQLQRKAKTRALLEKEIDSIKISKQVPAPKVTRAQILAKKKMEKPPESGLNVPLVENFNRLKIEGEEAKTVDEAIQILASPSDYYDKHPEKRMKAAYSAYEDKKLKELKIEHPTLRLSQLKQMVFKLWLKSPENPLNKV